MDEYQFLQKMFEERAGAERVIDAWFGIGNYEKKGDSWVQVGDSVGPYQSVAVDTKTGLFLVSSVEECLANTLYGHQVSKYQLMDFLAEKEPNLEEDELTSRIVWGHLASIPRLELSYPLVLFYGPRRSVMTIAEKLVMTKGIGLPIGALMYEACED